MSKAVRRAHVGRALMAVSVAALALLAGSFAWIAWRLVAVGAPGGAWWAFLDGVRVPPFELAAALLPVGACLACGRRGRRAAYVASALIAVAGLVLGLRFGMAGHAAMAVPAGAEPVPLPLGAALQAAAGAIAPRLTALAVGLGVAALMEVAERREGSSGCGNDARGAQDSVPGRGPEGGA